MKTIKIICLALIIFNENLAKSQIYFQNTSNNEPVNYLFLGFENKIKFNYKVLNVNCLNAKVLPNQLNPNEFTIITNNKDSVTVNWSYNLSSSEGLDSMVFESKKFGVKLLPKATICLGSIQLNKVKSFQARDLEVCFPEDVPSFIIENSMITTWEITFLKDKKTIKGEGNKLTDEVIQKLNKEKKKGNSIKLIIYTKDEKMITEMF